MFERAQELVAGICPLAAASPLLNHPVLEDDESRQRPDLQLLYEEGCLLRVDLEELALNVNRGYQLEVVVHDLTALKLRRAWRGGAIIGVDGIRKDIGVDNGDPAQRKYRRYPSMFRKCAIPTRHFATRTALTSLWKKCRATHSELVTSVRN